MLPPSQRFLRQDPSRSPRGQPLQYSAPRPQQLPQAPLTSSSPSLKPLPAASTRLGSSGDAACFEALEADILAVQRRLRAGDASSAGPLGSLHTERDLHAVRDVGGAAAKSALHELLSEKVTALLEHEARRVRRAAPVHADAGVASAHATVPADDATAACAGAGILSRVGALFDLLDGVDDLVAAAELKQLALPPPLPPPPDRPATPASLASRPEVRRLVSEAVDAALGEARLERARRERGERVLLASMSSEVRG